MGILDRQEERSEDEGEADCDGDKELDIGGKGQPRLKNILRLIRLVLTHWNSTYDIVKRALALKEALVQFTNSQRPYPGAHPTTIPVDESVEVFIRSYSSTTIPAHSYYAPKLGK